ncbi:hypothetical protein PJ985_15845 [Streptomyces sp. ACA25]|uniref:hypothetical protein n=1 Tax=Streptomyces sp. ACA25 TaxID=3022596 RepID=UPI0023079543|nr:hypothetical protein [Streptomyces sp. ACA25]MDB1089034.1 hypothetical protein [Streptomyces sp. ACA25]
MPGRAGVTGRMQVNAARRSAVGRLLPARRTVRLVSGTLALLLLMPFIMLLVFLRAMYGGSPDPQAHTRDRDALWLGPAWVDGRHDETDLATLAARLDGTGVRDVFVHTGPLSHDGTLPAGRSPRARWLTGAMAEQLPGVRVQAWLGTVPAGDEHPGDGRLRLDDTETRGNVVAGARQVLELGFDGIHLQVDGVRSGDPGYLELLEDLGAALHEVDAVLSATAHQIEPLPALHTVAAPVADRPKWWAQSYFREVSERVDQIAVPGHDAVTPLESLYGGYVAQQTELALQVTPQDTDLLIGLPFLHERDLLHRAETVPSAVRGVRLGLSREDILRERFGVGLYVDYAATPGDWLAYRRDWVGPAAPP